MANYRESLDLIVSEFEQTELGKFLCQSHACAAEALWYNERGITTLERAWTESRKLKSLLWALEAINYKDTQAYRLFSCWCIRQTWHLLDTCSRRAIEVAEAVAQGLATPQTSEAALAESEAAWVGSEANWDSYVSWKAREAAWKATCASTSEAAWIAAWTANQAPTKAARKAARIAQVDKLRELVPWPRIAAHIKARKEATE